MIVNTTLYNQYYILQESIDSIIEYVRQNVEKIKTAIKKDNKYEFLEQVNSHLNEIFEILFEYEQILKNELECLTLIKPFIIYIIGKNCENPLFGHIQCCIHLLNIFKSLINAKFKYLNNECDLSEYEDILKKYPNELYDFRMYFNEHIFINDPEFEEDMERLDLKLRSD